MKHVFRLSLILLTIGMITISAAVAGELEPFLADLIAESSSDDMIKTYLLMSDRVDLPALKASLKADRATLAQRHTAVIEALQLKAETTQQDLLAFLEVEKQLGNVESYKSLWIGNYVLMTAKPAIIEQVAARPDVDRVYYDVPIELIEPEITNSDSRDDSSDIRDAESGLHEINAHLLWAEGITGEGRLVSSFDTGVAYTHPALGPKWRGNNGGTPEESWFDPVFGSEYPVDYGSHGTHTMGTMVGSNDATGDTVGVAFNAQWIAVGALEDGDISSTAVQAFQWVADPDGDPNTMDDVPDVMNNSWGIPLGYPGFPDCYSGYNDAIDGAEAAGVVILFAAGNEGTSGLRSPGNRITSEINVTAVGALNPGSTTIANFSARGPSNCTLDPGQPDSLLIKPEICARGVDVRSTVPGGGYQGGWNGTSMATPHVAGAVALLREISPNASPEEIKWALINSSIDLGPEGNDNSYGFGRIDVYAASLLLGGHVEGHVTLPGLTDHSGVKVWSMTEADRYAMTDLTGFYKLTGLSEGTHTMAARKMGYFDTVIEDIEIILGETIYDVDFEMDEIGQTPENLIAISELSQVVPLSWDAPAVEPAYYKVYRSEEPGGPYELINWMVPDTNYDDTEVTNGHTYFYVVTAIYEDPFGETLYSEEVMAVPGEQLDLPIMLDFEEDDGSLYQVVIDPGNSGSLWEFGPVDPDHGPGAAASGENVWAIGLADDYANNGDTYLLTQLLNLTEVTHPKLTFDHWYETEATTAGQSVRGFDGGNVAVSTNAGDSWTVISPTTAYDDLGVPGLDQEPGFAGSSEGWENVEFDLMAYAGSVVTIRFRFGADAGFNLAGWFIDNVVIVDAGVTAVEDEAATALTVYLEQNHPNPFNPSTTISFQLPARQPVQLEVFNVSGQLVKTLVNETKEAGSHDATWDGTNEWGGSATSGVYFYRLQTDSYQATKRMVLLK